MNILYIHGMGGGGDSRIPSILNGHMKSLIPEDDKRPHVIVRTYDFDPEKAREQIGSWVAELEPTIIIGESLGSLSAIMVKGLPHILVSPSLNAPKYFCNLAPLTLIPGVTLLLDNIYRPKEGDRQRLHFKYTTLRKFREHRRIALENSPFHGSKDEFFAFFGDYDHYRKSGIVSVRTWRKYFGEGTYSTYPGTHFMEEEFIAGMLVPKILEMLEDKAGKQVVR